MTDLANNGPTVGELLAGFVASMESGFTIGRAHGNVPSAAAKLEGVRSEPILADSASMKPRRRNRRPKLRIIPGGKGG